MTPPVLSAPGGRVHDEERQQVRLTDTADLKDVRMQVRALVADAFEPQRLSDALVAMTELATNSLLYAGPGMVTVRAWLDERRLRVEVHDDGPGIGRSRLTLPPAASIGGRGLWLVRRLSDRWGSRDRPSAMVWFEMDRPTAA